MPAPEELRKKTGAIAERWLQDTLATYSDEAANALARNKDRFANPLGHALRVGTRDAVQALLDGKEAAEICRSLDDAIKMRAVQEFSPSEAVGFVFLLKAALRAEFEVEWDDATAQRPLTELEQKVDQLALRAFDVFVGYRERVYQLRVDEAKRSVSAVVGWLNRRYATQPADEDLVQIDTSSSTESQRGGNP